MIEIYIVKLNADLTEGRGPMVFHSAWEDKIEAEKVADYIDPYFKPGQRRSGLSSVEPAILHESFDEYKNNGDKKIKERALAKLTDYEKKLLGLVTS